MFLQYFDVIYWTIVTLFAMWVGTNVFWWMEEKRIQNTGDPILENYAKKVNEEIQNKEIFGVESKRVVYPLKNKRQRAKNQSK